MGNAKHLRGDWHRLEGRLDRAQVHVDRLLADLAAGRRVDRLTIHRARRRVLAALRALRAAVAQANGHAG